MARLLATQVGEERAAILLTASKPEFASVLSVTAGPSQVEEIDIGGKMAVMVMRVANPVRLARWEGRGGGRAGRCTGGWVGG